ncbi:MAG: hypothetical protein JWQ27_256 [Ferruginibacter sp.]|nr:hypothetical protein [Ferruginibacter sp.]
MKTTAAYHLLNEALRYLLIFLFVYTGVSKLLDHASFETALLLSPLLRPHAAFLVIAVPVVELVVAAMLLTVTYRRAGFVSSLLLMASFTGYIAYMIVFIPHLPCSCGGILQQLSWRNHLLFNAVLTIWIALALYAQTTHQLFIAINRTNRKPV